MNTQTYKPEGWISTGNDAREYYYSQSTLEKAAATGRILEARVTLCDADFSLHVDLGTMRGRIPRTEAVYNVSGEEVKDIAVITRVGKNVAFKVIGFETVDGETVAILSRRLAQMDCMENYLMDLIPGDVVDARITHLEPFGAFVDIGCGVISLLSIDCISVSRISHPRDRFYAGMPIKAVIKSIDREHSRIYVTHKELLGTWEENVARFSVGQTVAGTVRSIEPYGIFVELSPNLAGLAEYREGITAGQRAAVYIKNIIPEKMKVKLVLVDAYSSNVTTDYHLDYFADAPHIDRWVYSPEASGRVIETVFEEG
ncbi:MAG: S1 RNA-binding domain-containing protein [Clostridia bacterium]|nr:S1 RNA-binding domain-containing protein [Clostridia bacterium]